MMKTSRRVVAILAAASLSLCGGVTAAAAETHPAVSPGPAAALAATEAGPLAETLISEGRPATASSLETSSFPAAAAFDGSMTTRWASLEGIDPQWISVDLGAGASVSRVVLDWEAAYASDYTVQISDDGSTWTTLKDETAGDGGTDDISGLSGTGRYLRVHGTARGTSYGYSLFEVQVYGTAGSTGGGGGGTGTTPVTSIAQLQNAIDSADAGDTIVLADGTYAVSSSAPLTISGGGTSGNPVTIAAETVGGVTLTGSESFVFDNAHDVVIKGFRLTQSTTIDVPATSRAITFSRDEFVFAQSAKHNLIVRADDSVIEYSWFHGKSTIGVYLGIDGAGTTEMATGVRVHHNYFSDQSFAGDNGGEPIRLGVSSRALSVAGATIEYNLFERVNGDPEAISVKSSGNTIRYNTIRDSAGGIVLRHGNDNTVVGNRITDGANGIRIYGNDHEILNNYVAGVSGEGIVVGSGTVRDHYDGEPETSRKKNDAPDRIRIALNTIVGNGDGIAGETNRTVPPLDVTIVDNIIQGSTGDLANVPLMQDFLWRGNILWGAAADGNIPTVGYVRVNPLLVQDSAGTWRPSSSSPAIDAANQTNHANWVTDDIDGRARSGTYDVGAHEAAGGTATRAPLTTADVGPSAP